MAEVSHAIHDHHQELTARISAQVAKLSDPKHHVDGSAFVAFLKTELLPHAAGEERYLYPALEGIIKKHGSPTATMKVDHAYIRQYVSDIEAATAQLEAAPASERRAIQERLFRLTLRLEALFEVHLAKEEQVYLPLFERYVPEPEQHHILDGMHESPEPAHAHNGHAAHHAAQTLDVRELPPAQRHVRIFALFESLGDGETFMLVNDHDPKPLYYQMKAEHGEGLVWDYLEQGPEVWRVRIGNSR